MITLLQFPRPAHRASYSPFCLKLETYLKAAKVPYENKFTISMGRFSKKKLPVIIDKDLMIEDSTFIIEYLQKEYNADLDQHLTPEQKAIAKGFQWLCEKSMVDIVMYFRWADAGNWPKFREIVFKGAPWLVKVTIANAMAKSIKKTLYKHGTGRFTDAEKIKILEDNLRAISTYLGPKKYFFGNQISSIDTIVFATLIQLKSVDFVPQFEGLLDKFPNLKDYIARFSAEFWPEFEY